MPIVRRNYSIYGTMVFFTLYGWLSGLLVGVRIDQTATYTERKIPESHRVRSPDDGQIVARNM